MIRMHSQLLFLLIGFLLPFAHGQDRQITAEINPGCKTCTKETLVYVKADGKHDTVHQIWDFTRSVPTIIYAITNNNSSLNITWKAQTPMEFALEKPLYTFAAVIDKIQEYNDIEDNAHFDPKCPQKTIPLRYITWRRKDISLTDKEAMLHMHGTFIGLWDQEGAVEIKLDLLPFRDYAVDLPHLIHTANSTLVDVSLINLTTLSDFNSSRFAIHFTLVSLDPRTDTMVSNMRKSLDDEHTPGVFEIFEIKTPKSKQSGDGGFMQFRPVCYTEPERSVSSSTNAYITNFTKSEIPDFGTLRNFYRHYDPDDLLVQGMFISFGLPGDGFYKQHNYTSWSFTIGYGVPPVESFSLFVIIIISIGLGVPVVLAVSGITYVLVRRYKQRRNPPRRFTDSE